MNLRELLLSLDPNRKYEGSVYADTPFTFESDACIEDEQFEVCGLVNGKKWVGRLDILKGQGDDMPYLNREDEILAFVGIAEDYRNDCDRPAAKATFRELLMGVEPHAEKITIFADFPFTAESDAVITDSVWDDAVQFSESEKEWAGEFSGDIWVEYTEIDDIIAYAEQRRRWRENM